MTSRSNKATGLIAALRRDYEVNNKGRRALVILGIFRLGNAVHFSASKGPFRRFALLLLNALNRVFVFYPLGIEIPFSCKIGPGLRLPHQNGIVFQGATELGEEVTVYHQVTIGENERSARRGGAIVGDRVYIGAGAKIIGRVMVGDDATIGANAVVVKDVPPRATVICRQETLASKEQSGATEDRTSGDQESMLTN